MSENARQLKPGERHVRRSRLQGIAGALVPRSRAARLAMWLLVGVFAVGGIAALTAYALISQGIVTANIATPYIARAIEERLGPNYKVKIGATTMETIEEGHTVVIVHDIRVTGPGDELVASAPSAEVELEGSLLTLSPRARRIDLIGAEMTVKIAASGSVAVATGKGAKAITTTPSGEPLVPPLTATTPAPTAPSAGATPGAQTAPGTQAPAVAASSGATRAPVSDPLVLKGLAQWLEQLERGGLDGGALEDVGLKDGTLVVQNEASGRKVTFDDISIRLARPAHGGVVLTFTVKSPHSTATLVATIGPVADRERTVMLDLKDVSTRDLVQAFSQDWRRFYMDMPLSASLNARLALDGNVRAANAKVQLGAGQIGNGEDVLERFTLDGAELALTLDPQRRVVVIDQLVASKNANKVALQGEVKVPAAADQDWPYTLRQREVVFAGPEMPDPPLALTSVEVAGRYTPPNKQLLFEKGGLTSAAGGLSFTGMVDFGIDVPAIKLNAVGSRMPSSTVRRFWPVSIAPPARTFVLENVTGGTVDGSTIVVNMPLDLIGQKEIPLPEDAVHLEMSGTGFTIQALKGLPPIRDAKLNVVVTGRTVRVNLPEGTVVTPGNRKLAMTDGVFFMPDYFPREPRSQIRVKIDGPADAGIEVLGMDALKGPAGASYDPATTRGKLSALVQINIHFRKVADPADTDYSVEATLTDFGVDNIFAGQRMEGATVSVFATPAGILLRGDGKLAGAPATFEYEKKKDQADADLRVNATLDDSARSKIGIGLTAVSGPVLLKLVGATNNQETKANIELDLTAARISDLIPGLSKPAGRPLKARFSTVDTGTRIKINELVLDGSGALIKGSLELADNGDVNAANFPTFQLSDGDKASLKADRSGDVLRVRITGDVVDARGIMKSLVGSPAAPKDPKTGKPQRNQDVDVEAKIGALTGNNGEVLRQMDLTVSRRGVELRNFSLSAKVGREGNLAGEIRNTDAGRRALFLRTSDAGAVLRFLEIYPKIEGGDMWVVVDPPRGDSSPQEGTVNIRDFVVRGEPGLESLSAAARDSSGRQEPGTAVFQKAQAKFIRTPGSVTIREGAIWGPVAGVTVDGTIDFAAERISMRGTYVPAYGLNNLFSKVPVIGMLLGGGPNEGLVGVTFEVAGPMSGPTLRVNPLSAVAPGFLRKMFEFRDSSDTPPVR